MRDALTEVASLIGDMTEIAIFCSTGLIALALLLSGVHVAASQNGSSKPLIS